MINASNTETRTNDALAKVREWASNSSSHGLPSLARTPYRSVRVMWSLALAISISICLYSIINDTRTFFDYEVNINMDDIVDHEAQFPAVSFCSINPFYAARESSDLLAQMRATYNISDVELLKTQALAYLTSQHLNDTSKKSFGWQNARNATACRFDINECRGQGISLRWFFSPMYGNCYEVLNGTLTVSRSGRDSGLTIEAFVESNPIDANTPAADVGVRVFIRNNSDSIYYTDGIDVATGTETNIALTREFRYKLDYPYSTCVPPNGTHESLLFRATLEKYNSYSQKACRYICHQLKQYIEPLGCELHLLPLLRNGSMLLCNMSMYSSVNEYQQRLASLPAECSLETNCPLECNSVQFQTSVSFTDFPSRAYYKGLMSRDTMRGSSMDFATLKRSMVRVNVFYSTLVYSKLSEQPSQSREEFLASLGGTLGIYIGISCLSIIELVEIVHILIAERFVRDKNKKN